MSGEIKWNNPNFKAVYQEYDWCYERYILKGMTHEEMAKEANASIRVIQKWCVEKHGLHRNSFKELHKLNDIQKELIISGTLGDGHIDKRETQPMYIEVHADDEKDYMFWKYNILKNICNKPPVYKSENTINHLSDKEYLCKPSYRLNSRIIDDLKQIRGMSIIEKISNLKELGLSTYILDDGYRCSSNWELCIAKFTQEDKLFFINYCKDKFLLNCWLEKDDRYITFDANSSRTLDEIILRNIPNELDIIHKKILDKKLCKENNYLFVLSNSGERIGLSSYFRKIGSWIGYEKIRDYLKANNLFEISEREMEAIIRE